MIPDYLLPAPIMRIMFLPFPVVIIFIILLVSPNCLISRLTSWIDVPLPKAIRFRRDPLKILDSHVPAGSWSE